MASAARGGDAAGRVHRNQQDNAGRSPGDGPPAGRAARATALRGPAMKISDDQLPGEARRQAKLKAMRSHYAAGRLDEAVALARELLPCFHTPAGAEAGTRRR